MILLSEGSAPVIMFDDYLDAARTALVVGRCREVMSAVPFLGRTILPPPKP